MSCCKHHFSVFPGVSKPLNLLNHISRNRGDDFSGIGLVFYSQLCDLPHLELNRIVSVAKELSLCQFDLETSLLSLAQTSSPYHDGFHFISVDLWRVTHLSQFISPPIPKKIPGTINFGSGARFTSAMLSSLVLGIEFVGIVSKDGHMHLFHKGIDVFEGCTEC